MRTWLYLIMLIGAVYSPRGGACNPNQNCMTTVTVPCGTWKKPFRTCRKRTEDTLCAAARKVCQVNCASINQDASIYITQYYAEMNRINSEVSVIESAIASEQHHQSNYINFRDELMQSFEELTGAQKSGLYLIENHTKLHQFISENELENKDIKLVIDRAKVSNDPELELLANLLERARNISAIVEEFFNSAKLVTTLKSINRILITELSRIDREYQQTLQLIIETEKNIKQMTERLNNKTNESVALQTQISEQEARKCTPW